MLLLVLLLTECVKVWPSFIKCGMDEVSTFFTVLTNDQKFLLPLCVWCDWQGIIHYELLPNSDLYCQQLDRLNAALMQKRPSLINRGRIVFHQDNARPHTYLVTYQKLRELGWEVLLHPPYSPDLAPSDYHLFLSMANELSSRKRVL